MRLALASLVLALFLGCSDEAQIVDDERPIPPGAISDKALIRGANMTFNSDSYPALDEAAFDTWKDWGIDLIRFTFDNDDFTNPSSGDPSKSIWQPYRGNLAELEKTLGRMKTRDMKAMISLDHIWGDSHDYRLWAKGGDNEALAHRIALCGAFARWIRDKGFSEVVPYLEVWNEPYPCDRTLYVSKFLPEAIDAIRAENGEITVSVMPPQDWGLLWGFAGWNGVRDDNVVYSTHIYAPQTYTHQGVLSGYPLLPSGWPGTYKNYPGDAQAAWTDLESGRALMGQIRAFEERPGSEVLVTEFGVARWARDAGLWTRDLVSLMEEAEIGWLFHSIAGWNGWNPSFKASDPENKLPFGRGSPSLELLKYYWAQ